MQSARAAGLRYVSDAQPGIRRKRMGNAFTYLDVEGKPIRDPEVLRRIKSLAIPPAWTEVWICPIPRGHIQATGRDAKGRKQYRYHPRWREVRDTTKYGRMIAFGEVLPAIRARVQQDLAPTGLAKEKVLALVVQLLEATNIRIGNEEYARQNGSVGLTTMQDRNVKIEGPKMRFRFRGKSGKQHEVMYHDRRLARIVKQCQDIPGQELFQYVDEHGERKTIASQDINEYLRHISGHDFTAKDFRTWAGSVLALRSLRECEPCRSATHGKQQVVAAIKAVAEVLGNTPAVCRKCYVHPAIIESYLEAALPPPSASPAAAGSGEETPYALSEEERAVLAVLRRASADVGAPAQASRIEAPGPNQPTAA